MTDEEEILRWELSKYKEDFLRDYYKLERELKEKAERCRFLGEMIMNMISTNPEESIRFVYNDEELSLDELLKVVKKYDCVKVVTESR